MLMTPHMPSLDDVEGCGVPGGLPPVVDAHVHVFPDRLFAAVWRWFDENGWRIRYQMPSSRIPGYLLSRGVSHVVAFQYAHKPGLSRQLNTYMAETCARHPGKVTGMATVFPGEEDAVRILKEAFGAGLCGLKLHAHVQCFDMNGDEMNGLYECCVKNRKPVVLHVGREPKSAAYACDPYQLCAADKLERVLKEFPDLRVCVPHLGIDEMEPYRRLIEKYDTLWLDTAMAIGGYFALPEKPDLCRYRPDRVLYGSDFPNIPYAWDRELKTLKAGSLSPAVLEQITFKNAAAFFGISGIAI